MKKLTWWPVAAGAIAGLEVVVSVGMWIGRLTEDRTRELGSGVTVTVPSEFGPLYGDILFSTVLLLAAGAIIIGLASRATRPGRARELLIAGLIPGVLAGAVFFWFPPFWLVSLVSVAVMIRVALDRTPVPAQA